jgi:hypothetical protein
MLLHGGCQYPDSQCPLKTWVTLVWRDAVPVLTSPDPCVLTVSVLAISGHLDWHSEGSPWAGRPWASRDLSSLGLNSEPQRLSRVCSLSMELHVLLLDPHLFLGDLYGFLDPIKGFQGAAPSPAQQLAGPVLL